MSEEISGVHDTPPEPETGAALMIRGLKQLLAGDVSGSIGRLTLVLVAVTASMEVLRQFGLDDESYPFFTQEQGQAISVLTNMNSEIVCGLAADTTAATGRPVPKGCEPYLRSD